MNGFAPENYRDCCACNQLSIIINIEMNVMFKPIQHFFITLILSLPAASWADDCGTLLAQDELVDCLVAEHQKADKALNQTYQALRARLDNDARQILKKAQISWLSYRDNDCEFQASAASGGKAYMPLHISCMTEKTLHRTKELESSGW